MPATSQLMPHPVDVGALVEEVVASLNDRLASMKVTISLPDEGLMLTCDRQLMVMLLSQYIDNACKYSIFALPSPFVLSSPKPK